MEKRWGERNIGKYFRLRLDISLIVDSIFSRRYIYIYIFSMGDEILSEILNVALVENCRVVSSITK